jgi:flagellar biosynthesis/type III secretory pathway protein FliH
LSRVVKSHLYVTADPCRLEPPDPEFFLIVSPQAQELEDELMPGSATEVEAEILTEADAIAKAQEIIETAHQEAASLLEQARAEAEGVVAAANGEAAQIKAEAETAGTASGYQAGLTQIRQEMAGKLAQALTLLSAAELEYQRRILASEPEILKLAVAIATKIINAEINLAPEQQLAIVKQSLSRFGQASSYKIRINPANLHQLTEERQAELQSLFNEPKQIEMIPDPTIAPIGCFIETDHGKIDARLKTQMELIASELLKIVN